MARICLLISQNSTMNLSAVNIAGVHVREPREPRDGPIVSERREIGTSEHDERVAIHVPQDFQSGVLKLHSAYFASLPRVRPISVHIPT